MRELDRLDRQYGLGAPLGRAPRVPSKRRTRGATLPGLLVAAMVVVGVVAVSPADNMRTVRRLAGFGDMRLGEAPSATYGAGSYEFVATQPASDEPVSYDPCRTIEVAVNPEGAPANYEDLVDTAIRRTSAATGLRLERVGATDDRDFTRELTRIGARPPVLVAWATPTEVPQLAGRVAGIGGSVAVKTSSGRLRYVTGSVVLDSELYQGFGTEDGAAAQAIVDHEFGHLVGLAHVDDPQELMNEDNLGVTSYGPGDLEGLARLGSVDC